MKKFLSFLSQLLNFISNFHLQIAFIFLICYILLTFQKKTEVYYFDTDFIKAKFALQLAEKKNIKESEIIDEFKIFEAEVKSLALKITNNGIILKKNIIINGGVDVTKQLCEELNFSNCNVYE